MYQEHTLANGLRILMVPTSSFQSVSMGIYVNIGSRFETEAQAGISHFIEHMLFKGTTHRPTAKLIAEAIEGIGGVSNAYTGQETTVYYAKVAASQISTMIHFLSDLVKNPRFDPDDVEKERQIIGEEISMVYDSPDSWINILIDEVIWPNHPLGQSVAGTRQSLTGISRDTLVSFFKKSYHPHNILIAIGGEFKPEQVITEITSMLGDWQPQAIPTFSPAPEPQNKIRYNIEDRPIEQGHLCLALPGLSRFHPDRYALSLLNTILGDGMSSRLFLAIREDKGLAYAVDSGLSFLQDTGSMVIYAGVDPKRAAETLQAIFNELEALRDDPISTAEVNKAREYLKGRMVLGLEDSYSQASWVAYQALFSDTIKSPEAVIAAYDAVTESEIRALAQKIIDPACYKLAAIGPFGQGHELMQLIQ